MNLEALRTLAREQLQDLLDPYYCTDEQLNAFLNEAQREACLRAKLLYDTSKSVALVTDQAVYDLSETALGAQFFLFDRFALGGLHTHRVLASSTLHRMDAQHPGWEEAGNGIPEVVLLDQAPRQIRLWPAPSAVLAGVQLRLRGFRLPQWLRLDTDQPEIDPIWHEYLVDWARYRFYTVHDADMHAPDLAAQFLRQFEQRFGVRPAADLHALMTRRETLSIVPRMTFF